MLHGGILTALLDSAFGLANFLAIDNVENMATVDLRFDYLRPALAGTLHTNAKISKKGRRMASIETVAWQADADKPVAKGLFHFLLV